MKLATGGHIVSPPNIVYVTALPCEILIMTIAMLVHSKHTKNYFRSDSFYASKRQHELQHIIEMSSTVIKDSLLHNCPQLSQIARSHCSRHCVICCYS